MELKDFPRPKGDTGIGVQWSPGYPAAIGISLVEGRWMPLLRALGIKWVSFAPPGGVEFARLLLANDIMPIVQFGRRRAQPGRLSPDELAAVKAYIAAGVRYFELAQPLDDPESWRAGWRPSDIAGQVAPHLLADVEAVLQMGGLPGLPACGDAGLAGAVVAALCQAGKQEWLNAGVWQALRIQAGNLPLDYPNDPITTQGKPLSEEDYRRRSAELWDGAVWAGQTRAQINAERTERRDPQASLDKTPAGWRRHVLLDAALRGGLGRSIPVLGTAGGCQVGETIDTRYPSVSPMGHGARTLEMSRIMMGTSKLYPTAPGYLFCAVHSLLGNYALGHFDPRRESQAWISPRWPGGQLPVIAMLRDEPKRSRWGEAPAAPAGHAGDAKNIESMRPLFSLFAPDEQGAATPAAPPRAPEPAAAWPPAAVLGRLAGGAGRNVQLLATEGGAAIMQAAAADGSFAFRGLHAGAYRLSVPGTNLSVPDLAVASGEERFVPLTMPAWSWTLTPGPSPFGGGGAISPRPSGEGSGVRGAASPRPSGEGPGVRELPFSALRCSVEGRADLAVVLKGTGWLEMERHTGSGRGDGPFACEFAPLAAGRYVLEPAGLDLHIEVDLDGHSLVTVEITPTQAKVEVRPAALALPTNKGLGRYVLLARPLASRDDLFALLRFLSAHQPACGFSVAEAQWAREVIIVGAGALRVSAEDERQLRESGCRVMRVEERIAETLVKLSGMGDPFAEYRATS